MMIPRLLTWSDIADTVRVVRRGGMKRVLGAFGVSAIRRTEAMWSQLNAPNKDWAAVEQMVQYIDGLITGDESYSAEQYLVDRFLTPMEPLTGLSVGCGRGAVEIQFAGMCRFSSLTGLDLSRAMVAAANREAAAAGHPEVVFQRVNLLEHTLPESLYDVIFCFSSLHHFRNVEKVLSALSQSLRPEGILVVNEFAGPDRFQWSREQIFHANMLLRTIPEHYRTRWRSRSVKKSVSVPGLVRMLLSDPSEAIESSKIRNSLHRHFKPIIEKEIGGTLLHLVFHDIGWRFSPEDQTATRILMDCIKYEQEVIGRGVVASDFLFGVYQRNADGQTGAGR